MNLYRGYKQGGVTMLEKQRELKRGQHLKQKQKLKYLMMDLSGASMERRWLKTAQIQGTTTSVVLMVVL